MSGVIDSIKAQAINKYRDIAEQRLKTYRLALSPMKKLIWGTAYGFAMILLCMVLMVLYPNVGRITIDYSNCTDNVCTYSFMLTRSTRNKIQIYTKISNMPEMHMIYRNRNTQIEKHTDKNTGISLTETEKIMYPKDKYTLSDTKGNIYAVISYPDAESGSIEGVDDVNNPYKLLAEWREPSSFRDAFFRRGEIDGLSRGLYLFTVEKDTEHPEPNRQALIIANISHFGVVFSHINQSIVLSSALLVIVNSLACIQYI